MTDGHVLGVTALHSLGQEGRDTWPWSTSEFRNLCGELYKKETNTLFSKTKKQTQCFPFKFRFADIYLFNV